MSEKFAEGSGEKRLDKFIKSMGELRHLGGDIVQDYNNPRIRTNILKMRELADQRDRTEMVVKIVDTVGNGVKIAGSLLVVCSLLSVPVVCSLLSVPLFAGLSTSARTGIIVAGSLTSVGANVTSTIATNNIVKEAKPILEELLKSAHKLEHQLEESLQVLKGLETFFLEEKYWLKAFQVLSGGDQLFEKKTRELVEQLLSHLPKGNSPLSGSETFENLEIGIKAFYTPELGQNALQFWKLISTEESNPKNAEDVFKVATLFEGAANILSTIQTVTEVVSASLTIIRSTESLINTWTSSYETPATYLLRKIADELEYVYPPIQQ